MKKDKMLAFISLTLIVFIGCNKDSSIIQNNSGTENKITAAYKYNEVNLLANPEKKSNGLILESIKSNDVDANGAAEKWIYGYSSAGIAVTYYYQATKDKVMLDSVSAMVKIPPTQLISHKWIDSKDLLKIIENNGGYDFRIKNKGCKIKIALGEPLGYNALTYWYVTYYSIIDNNIKLLFVVDASSGEIKS